MLTNFQSKSQPTSSGSSPAVSPAAGSSGCAYKTVKGYNQQGLLTTETIPVGASTTYDNRGFPVTIYPKDCQVNTAVLQNKALATTLAVMGEKGGWATKTTVMGLPTDASVYTQSNSKSSDQSGASTVAVRCCAAFGIIFSALLLLA